MTGKIQGGVMGGVEDLYREVILEHFKSPRNKGRLESPNASADGVNPLCGDQIFITVKIGKNTVEDIRFEGHGCAISQASASMMTNALKGQSLEFASRLTQKFKSLFGLEPDPGVSSSEKIPLNDLESLEGVRKYPMRVKCALLSWNTLLEALKNMQLKEKQNG